MYLRGPRTPLNLPEPSIEIPDLPVLPVAPQPIGWQSIIPALTTVGIVVAIAYFANSSNQIVFYAVSAGGVVIALIAGVIGYFVGKRQYQQRLSKTLADYKQSLAETEKQIQAANSEAQRILLERDPAPNECLRRVRNSVRALGERRPLDPDFLCLRLGMAQMESPISIQSPDITKDIPEQLQEYALKAATIFTDGKSLEAPLVVSLADCGVLGICGSGNDPSHAIASARKLAQVLIVQLATHHWLHEVQCVFLGSSGVSWQSFTDLPHAFLFGRSFAGNRTTQNMLTLIEKELLNRERISDQMRDHNSTPILPYLVVFIDDARSIEHPVVSRLLTRGKSLGIYCVVVDQSIAHLPSECGAFVEVHSPRATLRYAGLTGEVVGFAPDSTQDTDALDFTRELARIDWPDEEQDSGVPTQVGLLELFGAKEADQLDLASWWDSASPFGYLKAPIGKVSLTNSLVFDISDTDDGHGPHGIVGGYTGSGKSELLKTIVLSLAATHHPYDLTFALIDYKGGAGLEELAELPHVLGFMTNLETNTHLVGRMMDSLRGELRRREQLFSENPFQLDRKHVDDYRRLPIRKPLPHLMIIFDEFAEFKRMHPEESRELVSIAAKGRSLGVHLLLATQNPEAAIDDEVKQNSRYTICLRMRTASDSSSMIGIPDAISLKRGQGYFHVLAPQQFQIGFAGRKYKPSGSRHFVTEGTQLIKHIVKTAQDMGLDKLSPVWQPELPSVVSLEDLISISAHSGKQWNGTEWLEDGLMEPLIMGQYDIPDQQMQSLLCFDPLQDGSFLVFGAPQTGKTLLIGTVLTAAIQRHPPNLLNIYILDFSRVPRLKVFENAPHVGAVIAAAEEERIERFFSQIEQEIARRSVLLGQTRIEDYNASVAPDQRLPWILVAIDDFGEFKAQYPTELTNRANMLLSGTSLGIFVCGSARQFDQVPGTFASGVTWRFTFGQAHPSMYSSVVGFVEQALADRPFPAGRGLFAGGSRVFEFQAALPASRSSSTQFTDLSNLVSRIAASWQGERAPGIGMLPHHVHLDEVLGLTPDLESLFCPIGLEYTTLQPYGFSMSEDGPLFLVTGAPRSGKTTVLRSWVRGAEQLLGTQVQFMIVDFQRGSLLDLRSATNTHHWETREQFANGLSELSNLVNERENQRKEAQAKGVAYRDFLKQAGPRIVVLIDDYPAFFQELSDGEREQLRRVFDKGKNVGIGLIIAGNGNQFPGFGDHLLKMVKDGATGVLLGSHDAETHFVGAKTPSRKHKYFVDGRGYLLKRTTPYMMQFAHTN